MIYLLGLLLIFELVSVFQKNKITPQLILIAIGIGLFMSTSNQYVQMVAAAVMVTSTLRFFFIMRGGANV